MSVDALDAAWVKAWAADLTAQVDAVLAAFDTYYPFPPGQNEVVPAAPGRDGSRAHPGLPDDLLTFYGVIDEVVLSDIGNAFFIHPSGGALGDRVELDAAGDAVGDGFVFASDGGGILYAAGADGSVYRSRTASADSGFDLVADGLRGFLERLGNAVVEFAATRTPTAL
ncbi:hypothetical protein ACFXGI_30830 [Streptomyces sp. NPDC059355]|uniref:hypothetical protein n=1 Tax=Streptomyces sp. NPDC059355 TaxID=3346811 RepID=UPI003681E465